MNSLFLIYLVLPLLNYLASVFIAENKVKNLIEKASMIFSLGILFAIYNKLKSLQILAVSQSLPDISLRFSVDENNIFYLFLLNFIWIVFGFYAERFLKISGNKFASQFKILFAFFIAFIGFIIVSANALTLLFFYNCLVIAVYFLVIKFIFKSPNNLTKIFSFLLFGEIFLLLLAITLTAKFGDGLQFNKDGVLNGVSSLKTYGLFLLYFGGIFLTILTSSHLLYCKNCETDSLLTYLFLPLFFGINKLFIFIKIANEIFGIGGFSFVITKINIEIIAAIFLVNLLISLAALLFSRNFKAVFFHLFFSQLLVAFFAVIIYAIYDETSISAVIPNFIFSSSLVFLTFSNLILYLKRAQNKDMHGLFYQMKITILLLLFGFFNLIGIVPALGLIEKYSLLKISFANDLFLPAVFFIINSLCLFIFTVKIFFPLFLKTENIIRSENDKNLSAKIDSASSLMLSALVIAIAIFILPIIQFFYR